MNELDQLTMEVEVAKREAAKAEQVAEKMKAEERDQEADSEAGIPGLTP